MHIVTTSALTTELKRHEAFIEHKTKDTSREHQSSRNKATGIIFALNRLGLIDLDLAHSLRDSVELTS